MADLEELVIRIRADTQKLESEMKKAQGIVTQSSNGMTSALSGVVAQARLLAPALSIAAVAAFTKHAIDAGDAIDDLSKRTGVSVETLSGFQVAAKLADVSLQELGLAIQFMNKNIENAPQHFQQLGIEVSKFKSLSTEEQFLELAEKISQVASVSERTAVLMDIFGRSGANLAILFEQGAEGIKAATEEAKKLGLVLSAEEAERMGKFNDLWDTMNFKLIALAQDGFIGVIDSLEKLQRGFAAVYIDAANFLGLIDQTVAAEAKLQAITGGKASYIRPDTVTEATFLPPKISIQKQSKESEAIDKARKSLEDYNRELKRQHEYAQLSPADAAARKAYYDTLDMAQKAGIKNAEELAQANAEVARSNEAMQDAMQESARFAAELKDQFAAAAKSIMFDSKNAGDALNRLGQALAEMIAQKYIFGGISDGLFGSPGGSGGGLLGSLFPSMFGSSTQQAIGASIAANSGIGGFFADGGNPPVGVPSIVGERGPEIFVPKVAGTIIPNHAMGGHNITVVQNFQVSNDVPALVDMKIREAAAPIVAAAHESVFAAIQKGGRESKLVGRRN